MRVRATISTFAAAFVNFDVNVEDGCQYSTLITNPITSP